MFTTAQSYYLVMTPGLITVGFFFGFTAMFILFMPTAWIYAAHAGNWSIWQFTYRSALLMWALGWCALQFSS